MDIGQNIIIILAQQPVQC